MFPSKEFKRRQLAIKDLKYTAEKWQTARMQLKLAESKLERADEQSTEDRDRLKEPLEQERVRQRAQERNRERGLGGRS